MLNNTYTLIGTAITNYERVEGAKYERYQLNVEVERKNKSRVDVYPITVLNWNKTIDVKQTVVGEVVIVNGYLNVFNDKVELVAQDVYVVGTAVDYKNDIQNAISPESDIDDEDEDEELEAEIVAGLEEEIGVDDDDLPF